MDARFYEAWFNTDHRVLGRPLHAFCLEDALILSLVGSPFMLGAEADVDYGIEDLLTAVVVCSRPGSVFLDAKFSRSWLEKIWILWARFVCRDLARFRAECQKLCTYIDDYNSQPKFWQDEKDEGDGKLRAPWVLANATFLMTNTTMDERRVWTMPLGKALWYAATISEQNGAKIQLMTEEEEAGMRELGITV